MKKPARLAARPAAPHIPLSVIDIYKGNLALGIPALELRPSTLPPSCGSTA